MIDVVLKDQIVRPVGLLSSGGGELLGPRQAPLTGHVGQLPKELGHF